MKIRAVTLGNNISWPLSAAELSKAERFLQRAQTLFAEAGVEVQTVRLATQPLSGVAGDRLDFGAALDRACREAGVAYCSVGPAPRDASLVADLIASTQIIFASMPVAHDGAVDGAAVQAAAEVIQRLSRSTDLGFGNLRFAAAAHCPPNIPFFPAAYHDGGHPKFSLALQCAREVNQACAGGGSIAEIEARLGGLLIAVDAQVSPVARRLEREFAIEYLGADFSPAPFPEREESISTAFERLGLERFGASGTLFAASTITRALKGTALKRWGFNGLMLPVLEDAGLAAGTAGPDFTVNDLLLYSAVCGTGLDTVPLPGDTALDELAGILLDMAALSTALNGKPLTGRLLPVPGKRAGEATNFEFDYFANGTVLPVKGLSCRGLLARLPAGD